MRMTQVVVTIGGGEISRRALELVEDDAVVVAADSGLDHAVDLGLSPVSLVGDLDSISAGGKMWAYAHAVAILELPRDKDATDTELALAQASAVEGATDLLLLGGAGDRLDHTLGALIALGAPALAHLHSVRALLGGARVHVLHPGRSVVLHDEPAGSTFSILALHGGCRGVDVAEARWPLTDADLAAGSALGVSNVTSDVRDVPTRIAVREGVLTVVVP
jgi:thiamine pyrophosphokinase